MEAGIHESVDPQEVLLGVVQVQVSLLTQAVPQVRALMLLLAALAMAQVVVLMWS